MKRYTLYQASRFAKISRYKLEQAIKDGLLTVVEGRGNIKCYILDKDLRAFLEKHGDQFIRLEAQAEPNSVFISPEINQFISKEIHEKLLSEKERIIKILEDQKSTYMPLLNGIEKSKTETLQEVNLRVKMLKEIVEELLPHVTQQKRSEVEKKLLRLA